MKLNLGTPKSHLISINSAVVKRGPLKIKKDIPIIQEILRVLGALCHEPGTHTKYIHIFNYTIQAQPASSPMRSYAALQTLDLTEGSSLL